MKRKYSYLFITVLYLSLSSAFSFGQAVSDSVKKTIKEQVIVRIDNKLSVGTVVAFLENGKETYFVYGYGTSSNKQQLSKKSVFEIGSISKTFTSLLLADLVQKGKIKLDDPIDKYLPDSVKIPGFNGHKITFADLATHTSGLPRMPDNFNPKNPENPYIDYGPAQLYAFLKTYQLKRAVGTYEYSNLGVGLLGHTLSVISGKSYEQMLQDVICKPLSMKETSTLNSSPSLTTGYAGVTPTAHWDFDVIAGAGAIRSNVEDMMRYIKAEMGLLSSALKPAMDLTQRPIHDAGKDMKIGLGWHIRSANNDEIIWHNGGTGGYRTFAGFSKKTNKAIIILNNSGQSPDDLGFYFFNPNTKITPVKKAITLSKQILQSYVGVYQIAPGAEFDVKLDADQLLVKLSGQEFIDVYPESETRFSTGLWTQLLCFPKTKKARLTSLFYFKTAGRYQPCGNNLTYTRLIDVTGIIVMYNGKVFRCT
ncbi:serine hydrolase [Spirosoma pollinicola]|nr:serine hydrolase [Spirosoma pollinicola]